MSLFEKIKKAQTFNGLEQNDFERYRHYCTRQLCILRSALDLKQKRQPNSKRISVKRPKTDQVAQDLRFLFIVLFEAERAWAYGMQLKEESQTFARKKFHMMKRFRKARQWAKELNELVNGSAMPESLSSLYKLEAQAYFCFISGLAFSEEYNWSVALENFSGAKKLLNALLSRDEALYGQWISSMEPFIRFCSYNLKRMDTSDEDLTSLIDLRMNLKDEEIFLQTEIDSLLDRSRAFNSENRHSRQYKKPFSGDQVITCNNPKINIILTQIQSVVGQESISTDKILSLLSQASNLAKIDNDPQVIEFIQQVRLEKTIARNVTALETFSAGPAISSKSRKRKSAKKDELKLVDSVTVGFQELKNLELVQSSPQWKQSIEARSSIFDALRLWYIVQSLQTESNSKEAYGIFQVLKEKLKGLPASHYNHLTLGESKVSMIIRDESKLQELEIQLQISNLSAGIGASGAGALDPIKHLSKASHLGSFIPLPCKPIFYDNALNDLEALEEKLSGNTDHQSVKTSVVGSLFSSFDLLRACHSFPQYNFRTYAVERAKAEFRAKAFQTDPEIIKELIKEGQKQLAVAQRQSKMQSMFEREKLVIE